MTPTLLLTLLACKHNDAPDGWSVPDRQPGERAPLTATCDDSDPIACLLPWPSSRFMEADPSTVTGLRLRIEADALPIDDDPRLLNLADGFSPITGIGAGFSSRLDEDTLVDGASLMLLVAEPGLASYGSAIPLQTEIVQGGGALAPEDLVIGRPRVPLPSNAEHVALVLNGLKAEGGQDLEPSRATLVALALTEPDTEEEAKLAAYFAPTRKLLADVGVDPASVLRVWDFTTRSSADQAARLDQIKEMDAAAFDAGEVRVVFDDVRLNPSRAVAMIALGHLEGLTDAQAEDGRFNLGEGGQILDDGGAREAPFRVVVPVGEGDYPVSLYGHGTGGDVDDSSFDNETAEAGLSKVGLRFDGWTGDTVFQTFAALATRTQAGTELSTASLLSSVADASAVLTALDGALGDALSADTINGQANPAAGRRPDTSEPMWMGGSLGGTMGGIFTLSEPRVRYAVLNVPGGGWTHFIPASSSYGMLEGVFLSTYGDPVDAALALLMSQTGWDDVDGAAWSNGADGSDVALLQMSIGDPILPNIGSEILAACYGAALLQPSIRPIDTLTAATSVSGGSALEQYQVPLSEGEYGVHGFAAEDTPAADAAMGQIFSFFQSALDGAPRIEHAALCAEDNADQTCDYSEAW